MKTLSAVLIVRNEENKLEECLKALTWTDEIVIADSGSTDKTPEIARRYTQKFFDHDFDNFAFQKNFGIEQATGDWILSIDADEIVSPELKRSIQEVLEKDPPYDGFYLNRVNYIFGKPLRFGGQGEEKILRLFRKGKGYFVQPIHEKIVVEGKTSELTGDLLHYSTSDLEEYWEKLHVYTDFEAKLLAEKGIRPSLIDIWVKPVLRFLYFYIFKLGFLDGYEGFLHHKLSIYYFFLKYSKLKRMLKKNFS
jgi:glycosyltransferase involved in cell wall biosynthesis